MVKAIAVCDSHYAIHIIGCLGICIETGRYSILYDEESYKIRFQDEILTMLECELEKVS